MIPPRKNQIFGLWSRSSIVDTKRISELRIRCFFGDSGGYSLRRLVETIPEIVVWRYVGHSLTGKQTGLDALICFEAGIAESVDIGRGAKPVVQRAGPLHDSLHERN